MLDIIEVYISKYHDFQEISSILAHCTECQDYTLTFQWLATRTGSIVYKLFQWIIVARRYKRYRDSWDICLATGIAHVVTCVDIW